MKITRTRLAEMIEEEVRAALFEKGKKEKPKKPSTAAADEEPPVEVQPSGGGGNEPIANAPPIEGGLNDDGSEDTDSPPDPTDGKGEDDAEEDDAEAVDADGKGGEEPSGAVNNWLSGKTVQAITVQAEGNEIPGKAIIITVNETSDALKILVTPSNQIKFLLQNQIHDLP